MKTSAILFGSKDVLITMICHGVFLCGMAYIGWRVNLGVAYFIGLAIGAALAASQYVMIRGRTREGCFKAFLHNNWIGAAIFAGIALDFCRP